LHSRKALLEEEGPSEWIPGEWKSLFRGSAAMVTIPRRRLLRSVVVARHRWVNISGAPGSGRTTLLQQIVGELERRRRPSALVSDSGNEARTPSQILSSLAESGRTEDSQDNPSQDNPQALQGSQLPQSQQQDAVLLVDDFDYWLDDGRAEELRDIFRKSPSLTVVVVTLNPMEPNAWFGDGGAGDGAADEHCFVPIRGSELAFTLDEIEALSAAIVGFSPDLRALEKHEDEQLKATTGGFPLAVGLAFDRWYAPEYGKLEGFNVGLALQAIRRAYSTKYPLSAVLTGPTRVAMLLSFMPRFNERHVRMLSEAMPGSPDYAIFDNLVFGLRDSSGPSVTGYAWKDSAWRVYLEWDESSRDVRRDIALKLLDMGDFARAFDQMVLLSDISAAEHLLALHFMEIYEGFAPEVQEILLGLPLAKLDRAPYMRLAVALLKLELGDVSSARRPGVLGGAAEVVSNSRHGKQALVASGAIALRRGKTRDAYSRAERALAGAAGPEDVFQAAQLMLRCGALPETPFLSLAEGRMMSVNEALTESLISKIAGGGGIR
jgi:hypothetical protein